MISKKGFNLDGCDVCESVEGFGVGVTLETEAGDVGVSRTASVGGMGVGVLVGDSGDRISRMSPGWRMGFSVRLLRANNSVRSSS